MTLIDLINKVYLIESIFKKSIELINKVDWIESMNNVNWIRLMNKVNWMN